MGHHEGEHEVHIIPYSTYFIVWFSLLVLTGLTVAVAGVKLGTLSALTALAIALVKSTVVLMFFMHLKYESKVFFLMLMVCLATLTIIIGITFFDTLYR